jgi:hypothetical protein
MVYYDVIYFLIVGAPVSLLFIFLIRWFPRRPIWLNLMLALSLPLAIYTICVVWARFDFVKVSIDKVSTGVLITKPWLQIQGTVCPNNANVFLLVRAITNDAWWVQSPVKKAPSGAWLCDANFGTSTDGTSEDYLVIAVATRMPWLFGFLSQTFLIEGSRLFLLPPLSSSDVNIVRRRP